jgi:hypothetical protein
MKEHFDIPMPFRNGFKFSIPAKANYRRYISISILLLISIIIVYPILGLNKAESYLSIILLFLILYVIFNSISTENLYNELPSTIYPYNPNLGLDGISLSSYVAGIDTNQYV